MNRPRTGRSTAARDGVRGSGESELEAVCARVRDGLLEVQKHQDRCREFSIQIMALEEEIKSRGSRRFEKFPHLPPFLGKWHINGLLSLSLKPSVREHFRLFKMLGAS